MEKKLSAKKKAKSQVKREEMATKEDENCLESQTSIETAEDRENSQLKSKKSRKRKISFEEDVIDGFLMVSYATLEDLEANIFKDKCGADRYQIYSFGAVIRGPEERGLVYFRSSDCLANEHLKTTLNSMCTADGPLKPGAIFSNNDEPTTPTTTFTPMKKRRDVKSNTRKTLNGVESQKNKKGATLPRKPKSVKAEKSKQKTKKTKDDTATITKPETPLAIITEEENKPVELIKNVLEKREFSATQSIDSCTEVKPDNLISVSNDIEKSIVAAATTATTASDLFVSEKIVSKVSIVTNKESTKCKEEIQASHAPRKPLSDFSINAIQSMRGSSVISTVSQEGSAAGATKTPSTPLPGETQTETKSIATMTAEPKQDKSISPMEFVMRKETGFQYSRYEETKISATMGRFSPAKSSCIGMDDTVIRKSVHHQIDLTGSTITATTDKSRSVISGFKGREMVPKEGRNRSPKLHSENRPPSSSSLSSSQESTKHQHQHQHIHQHQHSHQHQHFHPPYGMVPMAPSYYGGMPYLPPVPGSTAHNHLSKPVPKQGKWCSLHVKIAHLITKAQKEVERTSNITSDGMMPNRPGLHAFQAVPSRANYERDFPFHSSMRPHMSASPKSIHSTGLIRGSFSGESERHPFHHQGRHLPYFHGRDGLASSHKRPEFEPPFTYDGLSHPLGRAYHSLFDRDRSSPPHLESMYHRRAGERGVTDIEKPTRLLHHDRSILNMTVDRETHHEAERHRHTSFLNRDKSSYFQPVKVDTQSCRSLTSHSMCASDLTRKISPRRLSPLGSSLTSQKPHLRGTELFDRFHPDHMDHRRFFGTESRLIGGESRIFGQESRLFSTDNRLMGTSEPRLFGPDKRLPTGESRLLGTDARKGLLPFGHEPPVGSHAGILGNLGRMSSKYTSSS
eukprot:gene15565-6830_t